MNYLVFLIGFFVTFLLLLSITLTALLIREKHKYIQICQDQNRKFSAYKKNVEDEIKQKIAEMNMANKELYQTNILLNREKDKSSAVIKYMGEGVIVTDNDGTILEFNDLARKITGTTNAGLIDKNIKDVITYPLFLDSLENMNNKLEEQLELEIPAGLDRSKTINIKITKAMDKKGNPLGLISVIRDVSKQRELDDLKNHFLQIVSHELNTPLTNIIGFVEILKSEKRGLLNSEQQNFLSIIHQNGNHLKQIIADILDISLIEANKLKLNWEKVDLCSIYQEVVDSLKTKASNKGIDMFIDNQCDLPQIITDKGKAQKIFVNLLSNAIKFTDKGYIKIYFSAENNYVSTHIEDTGIGLYGDDQKLIFDKFRQIDTSMTRKYEGLGIGLCIVKNLLNLLGGDILVHSQKGKGSVFTFTLPTEHNTGKLTYADEKK